MGNFPKYKIVIFKYEDDCSSLEYEDEEYFDEHHEVKNFFANIKDKGKNYKYVYEIYKINYELVDVSDHKDIVCNCD